jgi:hypothetical protein
MSLALKSSGGGSVTLDTQVTASTFTLTVPALTGTVVASDGSNNVSVAGNLSFNSGYGSAAVVYGCRAWVNFDGTTTPPTIRASGNIASVVRNSTGNYTITFTNAMVDANYVMNGNAIQVGAGNGPIISIANGTTPAAGSINIICTNDAGAVQNASIIHITIHR